jgi:nucleoside-diphosphate-sugar epimerase
MNKNYPKNITDLGQLEELLSRPSQEVLETVAKLDGDFLFLGIAGKIGPSLANMVGRACKEAGVQKKIIGVSRFSDKAQKQKLEQLGVETIAGDLMETDFIDSLPQVKNVIFLAGMKFGSEDNLALTWAVNSYLPAMVAEKFKNSRIVAFSTGCVYPLVDIKSGGSLETDMPMPSGEYAQSCLGRERMFEYGSKKYNTPVAILRLNYAVEMRYGVLVDIAYKIKNDLPVGPGKDFKYNRPGDFFRTPGCREVCGNNE